MANNLNSNIQGIYPQYRKGKDCDALRVFIRPEDREQFSISAKVQPTLKEINEYLKENGLRKKDAEKNVHFAVLYNRLINELKSEHGLKIYNIQKKIDFKSKSFKWGDLLDDFEFSKEEFTISRTYRSTVENFWLPFFIEKMGCDHPRDFTKFKRDAKLHVRSSRTPTGKRYSYNTWPTLINRLNAFMNFCLTEDYITDDEHFKLNLKLSTYQRKVALMREKMNNENADFAHDVRSKDTYTLDDLYQIKQKIDFCYENNLKKKLRAYGLFIGVITGIRRANLLGVRVKDLKIDAEVPHFEVNTAVYKGWNFKIKGVHELQSATKTTLGEGIKLPFLAPDVGTAVEVCKFLKQHLGEEDRIVNCYPDTVRVWWKVISKECRFRYLSPHVWRHSFATYSALRMDEWFNGNQRLLQKACIHSSFRTTEKYINDKADQLLKAFERIKKK